MEVIRRNLKLDVVENKWSTTYPYKTDPSILRDNRKQAEDILIRQEKRLKKNPEVQDQYRKQFQDFIARGVFREISEVEREEYKGPVNYISHHEVFKSQSSSTPTRIVSNSSLKNRDGLSLNEILMKGPNSLNNIFSIQLRFRTYPCALVGDISKMYNSVATTTTERHLRRLLWRDMDVDIKPRTYGMETVMFGDKPAAAICATAISQTAEKHEYIDPVAAEKIKRDMYVDDITSGDKDVEKTTRLKENMTEILAKGGFKVKGFVMSGETSMENLSLLGTGEIGRILGIGWSPVDDMLIVKVRINISRKFKGVRKSPDLSESQISQLADEKLTRRMLLCITNSCYDSFGIVSPITVQLKIELRKLYSKELGLSWDADIPQVFKSSWVRLIKLLKSVDGTKYQRCVHDPNSKGDPELVVFCDGSLLAMCAVAYVRWELKDGRYSTYLFAAKTRVTPLEKITIPRAEMQSAVMAVRLASSIVEYSGYNFRNIFFISDSTCTIATLKKDSVALLEYMGNRVAEINASTKVNQWYHCKSRDNIADLGTRMDACAKDVAEGCRWQRGPSWLREDTCKWPVSQDVEDIKIPEEEMRKKGICYTLVAKDPILNVEKIRTYSCLIRITARIFRVLR